MIPANPLKYMSLFPTIMALSDDPKEFALSYLITIKVPRSISDENSAMPSTSILLPNEMVGNENHHSEAAYLYSFDSHGVLRPWFKQTFKKQTESGTSNTKCLSLDGIQCSFNTGETMSVHGIEAEPQKTSNVVYRKTKAVDVLTVINNSKQELDIDFGNIKTSTLCADSVEAYSPLPAMSSLTVYLMGSRSNDNQAAVHHNSVETVQVVDKQVSRLVVTTKVQILKTTEVVFEPNLVAKEDVRNDGDLSSSSSSNTAPPRFPTSCEFSNKLRLEYLSPNRIAIVTCDVDSEVTATHQDLAIMETTGVPEIVGLSRGNCQDIMEDTDSVTAGSQSWFTTGACPSRPTTAPTPLAAQENVPRRFENSSVVNRANCSEISNCSLSTESVTASNVSNQEAPVFEAKTHIAKMLCLEIDDSTTSTYPNSSTTATLSANQSTNQKMVGVVSDFLDHPIPCPPPNSPAPSPRTTVQCVAVDTIFEQAPSSKDYEIDEDVTETCLSPTQKGYVAATRKKIEHVFVNIARVPVVNSFQTKKETDQSTPIVLGTASKTDDSPLPVMKADDTASVLKSCWNKDSQQEITTTSSPSSVTVARIVSQENMFNETAPIEQPSIESSSTKKEEFEKTEIQRQQALREKERQKIAVAEQPSQFSEPKVSALPESIAASSNTLVNSSTSQLETAQRAKPAVKILNTGSTANAETTDQSVEETDEQTSSDWIKDNGKPSPGKSTISRFLSNVFGPRQNAKQEVNADSKKETKQQKLVRNKSVVVVVKKQKQERPKKERSWPGFLSMFREASPKTPVLPEGAQRKTVVVPVALKVAPLKIDTSPTLGIKCSRGNQQGITANRSSSGSNAEVALSTDKNQKTPTSQSPYIKNNESLTIADFSQETVRNSVATNSSSDSRSVRKNRMRELSPANRNELAIAERKMQAFLQAKEEQEKRSKRLTKDLSVPTKLHPIVENVGDSSSDSRPYVAVAQKQTPESTIPFPFTLNDLTVGLCQILSPTVPECVTACSSSTTGPASNEDGRCIKLPSMISETKGIDEIPDSGESGFKIVSVFNKTTNNINDSEFTPLENK